MWNRINNHIFLQHNLDLLFLSIITANNIFLGQFYFIFSTQKIYHCMVVLNNSSKNQ